MISIFSFALKIHFYDVSGKKQTTKTSKSPKKLKVCTRVSFDDNVHSQSGKSNISVDVKKSDVTPDKSYTPMDRSATAEEYYLPDDILERPFLIQVPPNSPHFHFRSYRSALNGNFGASEKGKRSRLRRSLPMLRLLVDPNAKLDMSKTLENIGTVTKHAFEDERAPMYHVRDVVGSTKNTVLSFLRILPQEAIIPSQYKIVDRKRERSNVAETNRKPAKTSPETGLDDQFFDVVQKLGAMVKESVRAGQETFQHMNDVAHSARKVVATTRHSLPAVLLPYARTPVLQKKTSGKLTLLAPRFADVAENRRDGAELEYVSIGDVMDVFGVSDPNSKGVGLTKITIHPKLREGLQRPRLKSRFGENSLEEGAELAPNYFVTSEHLNGDDLDADEGGENGMEALGSRNGVEVTDHDKRNKNIMQLLVDLKDMLDVEEYVADDAAAISVEATTKISSNESTEGKNKKQRKQQQKFDRGHETNDSSGDVRQIGSKQCRKIGACKHRMLNKNKLKSADFS